MPRYTVVESDAFLESGFGVPGLLEALIADLDPQQKYDFRVKAKMTKIKHRSWKSLVKFHCKKC